MTELVCPESEVLLYQDEHGCTRVEVRFNGETAWLSLGEMTEQFPRDKSVIPRRIKNVFEESELERSSGVAESATTAVDGKPYQVECFNLDVVVKQLEKSRRTPRPDSPDLPKGRQKTSMKIQPLYRLITCTASHS